MVGTFCFTVLLKLNICDKIQLNLNDELHYFCLFLWKQLNLNSRCFNFRPISLFIYLFYNDIFFDHRRLTFMGVPLYKINHFSLGFFSKEKSTLFRILDLSYYLTKSKLLSFTDCYVNKGTFYGIKRHIFICTIT